MKLLTFLLLLSVCFVYSCENRKNTSSHLSQKHLVPDTIDATEMQPARGKNELRLEFTDKAGNKDTNGFSADDTIILHLHFQKKGFELEKNDFIGLVAKTKNLSIRRIKSGSFELHILTDKKLTIFQIAPYIYCKNRVFRNAFHDTIDGIDNQEFGHTAGLTEYAFPLKKQ